MQLPAFVLLALSWASVAGQMSFDISPSEATEGITESVSLHCQLDAESVTDLGNDVDLRILMVISQTDLNGTSSTVAQIDLQSGIQTFGPNRTTASGSLSEVPYHLSVEIEEPLVEDSGEYECRLIYMGAQYEVVDLMEHANLTVEEPLFPVNETTPPPPVVPVTECACENLWAEINAIKEALSNDTRPQIAEVAAAPIATTAPAAPAPAASECQTSFSAQFSSPIGPEFISGEVLAFDSVTSNRGDNYDATTGEFTAPCDGNYYFSLTLRTRQDLDSGYVDGVILADGVRVARTSAFVNSPDLHIALTSAGSVVTLTQGQTVKVVVDTSSSGTIKGQEYSVFSGFFLSA